MAVSLLTGCSEETTPGGPGAATTTSEGEPANEDATFKLELPTGATNIEAGMTQTVSIGIDRGETFNQDVTVTFMPPQGVTVEPAEATIGADAEEVEVTIRVDATAQPGEQIINVSGSGGSGPPATGELKIEVTRPDADDVNNTATPPAAAPSDTPPATTPPATPPADAAPATPPADTPPADTPPADNPPATDPANPDAGSPSTPPANPENPEGGEPKDENPNETEPQG
jgi:hypothetical protein